jgi:NAD+ synthase
MESIFEPLKIEPAKTSAAIEALLREKLDDLSKDGILIGLSSGLDSAVSAYLSVRALGRDKVHLLNLPDRDSKAIHRQHAALVARELGIELQVREITPLLEAMGIYNHLPTSFLPSQKLREIVVRLGKTLAGMDRPEELLRARFRAAPNSLVARGKAYAMTKHRLRMVLLYERAEIANLMVVGAANRTELLTGTFSLWGCDHCADVMPILHLYRSQLPGLAEYLQVPLEVRSKSADPDILPGVDNKEELLGSFKQTDHIL